MAPHCNTPAPLKGSYDAKNKGYIVKFHDGTDARVETERLANVHGFALRRVFAVDTGGSFSAEMSPSTLAAIRCEMSVDYVEYDVWIRVTERRAT
jgi:hypothetical protein